MFKKLEDRIGNYAKRHCDNKYKYQIKGKLGIKYMLGLIVR